MIDKTFWQQIASSWISIFSKEDAKKADKAVAKIIENFSNSKIKELSLRDELLLGLDEDDDDGY